MVSSRAHALALEHGRSGVVAWCRVKNRSSSLLVETYDFAQSAASTDDLLEDGLSYCVAGILIFSVVSNTINNLCWCVNSSWQLIASRWMYYAPGSWWLIRVKNESFATAAQYVLCSSLLGAYRVCLIGTCPVGNL